MMLRQVQFSDRREAGRSLAVALAEFKNANPVILALPRGGVPIGYEVATALDAPLDIILVRKLGAPGHEEYGIGAIVDGASPQVVLDDEIVRMVGASPDYIDREVQRQLAEIERRRTAYGSGLAIPLEYRTAIVVDDGIATGGTVKAALKALRKTGVSRVILAVPVAPRSAIAELRQWCDDIVCLAMPEPFYAVGAHYRDFSQTSDNEVVDLLAAARSDSETHKE
ncbi:phosphoribosyltransferase [Altererythrobacter sp.]|uniref:phosphoribosyltransferase n=1 Tax=Altererythrobacter sp. TaxID=1872480 RepID=UPI003D075E12